MKTAVGSSHQASAGRSEPTRWQSKQRYGIRRALFRPIGIALAVVIVSTVLLGLGTGYVRSVFRHVDYTQAQHADRSLIASGVERQVSGDLVELRLRHGDGRARQVLADPAELGLFVDQRLEQLAGDRHAAKAAATEDARLLLDLAFADAGERIERYADWFYAWRRSYVVLQKAAVSAAHRTVASGVETWREAVDRDLADYFMHNFDEQVLRPEFRGPLIEEGVRNGLRRAHDRYVHAVAVSDLQLQLFVQRYTSHLDRQDLDDTVQVDLDWDAQSWKAPTHQLDDRPFDGAVGVGLMAVTAGGGKVLGRAAAPAIAKATQLTYRGMATRMARSLAGRASTTVAGAGLGSAVPVVGSTVGATLGFAFGAALDYLGNRADEAMTRETFVADNVDAVDAVKREWGQALEAELHRTIDVWFDDTQSLLERLRSEDLVVDAE